ncbi:sugar phosphate isomerase/epimerase family protein [Ammonicoccus fulvus]|uniref:Sugar phosphate isomerase/epimerase family protein n=1 Tax=Ammonicoccus fulvus TaxID=3138240 RepID=A0ABZ3FTU2_9ACTN
MSAPQPAIAAAPFSVGYGTNGFADHSLDDAVQVLRHFGYAGLGLTLGFQHLDPFAPDHHQQADRVRELIGDWPLVIETGTRFLLDPFVKHRPTLVDEHATARLDFLAAAIGIAARTQADCVSLWSGTVPAGDDPGRCWDRLVDRMQRVTEQAAAAGVRLAFEPEPGMLVETVADAFELRERLGNPEVLGITVDLGHCVAVEPDGVVGALRQAGRLLRNVQVDDMLPGIHEHLELGTGELDLVAALRTLVEIDYTGLIALELPRHSHDAPGLAARSMAALDEAWLRVEQHEKVSEPAARLAQERRQP